MELGGNFCQKGGARSLASLTLAASGGTLQGADFDSSVRLKPTAESLQYKKSNSCIQPPRSLDVFP
jgi:hypothetical protein